LWAVHHNGRVRQVLDRAERLNLPDWYLTAGCLFQTVWNVIEGHDAERGIRDYDLFYFDDRDLSWAAEDEVIQRAAGAFGDLAIKVEVRNEARVHLWYEEKYGIPCAPFESTEQAIDGFAATTCCVGITVHHGCEHVYAPHGFDDLFQLVLRPNRLLAPQHVYEAKAARWRRLWPRLTVLPWDHPAAVGDPLNEGSR
jgi:hypothetical protein